MFLRVVIASILCLYGLTAYSSWGGGKWGVVSCTNWEPVKEHYEEHLEDLGAQYAYAHCLYIKGKNQNNQADVSEALSMLHNLTYHGNIPANNFLAEYFKTDGTMNRYSLNAGIDNIEESITHYQAVLDLIEGRPLYGSMEDDFYTYERNDQLELQSYMTIPHIYLQKYFWGAYGAYNQKLLESPSYTGDRDLKTYPEYAEYTEDSLIQMRKTAEACLSVPLKEYFKAPAYHLVRTLCEHYKEEAEQLYKVELQIRTEIVKDHCRDIKSPKCALDALYSELNEIIHEFNAITKHIRPKAQEALWSK